MKKWCRFNHVQLTVMEALELLDKVVDESDPDVSNKRSTIDSRQN